VKHEVVNIVEVTAVGTYVIVLVTVRGVDVQTNEERVVSTMIGWVMVVRGSTNDVRLV
jgi:hypothetical protein